MVDQLRTDVLSDIRPEGNDLAISFVLGDGSLLKQSVDLL